MCVRTCAFKSLQVVFPHHGPIASQSFCVLVWILAEKWGLQEQETIAQSKEGGRWTFGSKWQHEEVSVAVGKKTNATDYQDFMK